MTLTRRNFLSTACAATASLVSFQPIGFGSLASRARAEFGCALLDLNPHCVLPESFQGYQAAITGEYTRFHASEFSSRDACRLIIIPGLGAMDAAIASALSETLRDGTSVLLESGAGFLSPAEFSAHQELLDRYFDIAIERPVNLWSSNSAEEPRSSDRRRTRPVLLRNSSSVPYVNYSWPRETKVRDYSRVVPVSVRCGDVIGRVEHLPVAVKRSIGRGTLIFLGSPMGPALHAGDREARQWLRSVIGV